jgi:NAD(P)-dependent dehydrogenase (short-subunit alcohol dehydrogenase family)
MKDGLRTFDGAVAIVTGAASGIGKAIAETLAARGSEVVLTDIDHAEAAASGIRERGGRASARHLDVTNAAEFDEVVNETVGRLGRLDYVFNNAGIGVAGEVGEHTLEAWDRILGVNLKGVIHGVQFAYPVMLRQGFGHIVNTASMAGLATLPGTGSYTTTKHAVVALSRVLRAEAWSHGIRVSVLCPGVIRTPILEGGRHGIFLAAGSEEAQRNLAREFFEQFRPMPPETFARKALDRIARNQAIIIVPAWWRVFWWMERAAPSLWAFLGRKGYERGRARLLATLDRPSG